VKNEENIMPSSVRYQFFQRFAVPARKAYNWCTSYDPSDHVLMDDADSERQITYLTKNAIILTDFLSIGGNRVEKQKIVQLYPDRLMWISTHLTGPIKYSQFIYEISAESKTASRLDFTGLFVNYGQENLDSSSSKKLAESLRKEDSEAWKLLAKAMAKDLCKR
jgi:hypothetical protein